MKVLAVILAIVFLEALAIVNDIDGIALAAAFVALGGLGDHSLHTFIQRKRQRRK